MLDCPAPMREDDYQRYVRVNLPHARTILTRIGRTLEALGPFGDAARDGGTVLHEAFDALERELRLFDEDPVAVEALATADRAAALGRTLVDTILETPARSDRLGQHVRNLFECLGLFEEGATLSLQCGERPDSPMR